MAEREPDLQSWVGRREVVEDTATAAPVIGLSATLDYPLPDPRPGDPVPPGWHWLYFLPRPRQSELGPDGHAARGGFMPPVRLPRRMFAGGRMVFHRPIRIGEELVREGEIASVAEKEGRSGPLVFVTVRYRIRGADGLAVEEEQDIVYREAPGAGRPAPPPEPAEIRPGDWRREIRPDPVLLFRFSALTFNGHRIHYDHPYVTRVEGYPGLIVHGPLIALLLLELARKEIDGRAMTRFAFRARRPVFDTGPFTIAGRPSPEGAALFAVDGEGALAMTAEAAFAG